MTNQHRKGHDARANYRRCNPLQRRPTILGGWPARHGPETGFWEIGPPLSPRVYLPDGTCPGDSLHLTFSKSPPVPRSLVHSAPEAMAARSSSTRRRSQCKVAANARFLTFSQLFPIFDCHDLSDEQKSIVTTTQRLFSFTWPHPKSLDRRSTRWATTQKTPLAQPIRRGSSFALAHRSPCVRNGSEHDSWGSLIQSPVTPVTASCARQGIVRMDMRSRRFWTSDLMSPARPI
jgi:hypothetical protein